MDKSFDYSKEKIIRIAAQKLSVSIHDIKDIIVLKKGMTNRSFLFSCHNKKYIMRVPGEGTENLIDRGKEASVYKLINGKNICDDIIYINPDTGYKISKYLENARVCNPLRDSDLRKCMTKLRELHKMKLSVDHEFDIFGQIEFYEKLRNNSPSLYKDYEQTKRNVLSLKKYIDTHVSEKVLSHIDAVPDNFLFIEENGNESVRLIDWEYAGMQDPHIDVAMFCIYALYNKEQVDKLIRLYFIENCTDDIRIKIYCYIAACGLLWSNWCEYKRYLGVEFGEYAYRQYQYAKEYYEIVQNELKKRKRFNMHKVEQAIIMAAGKGTRLYPVTLHTPKPLITVNGVRMIDTIIRSLQINGIKNIYIVVGHLKEQFQSLKSEYSGIHLIENPYYNTCNNISSLYVARDYIENAIILDGDQIIYNKKILAPEFEYSGYNAIWTDTPTKEWLMTVENSIVVRCSRDGGNRGWELFGISRWNEEDGRKLKHHIEIEFEKKKNSQIYWDDIVMFCYPKEYVLGIHKMQAGDVVEIDDLYELIKQDKSYAVLLNKDGIK